MRKFQGTGVEGPNNTQGLPDDNVSASFAIDLGFETVYDPRIFHALDALRQ